MFANHTQLHLVAVHPPPDKKSHLMQHPCAGDDLPCSHVCTQTAHSPILQKINQENESHLYTCLCPPAFFLDNERCTRMAECTFQTFYCHSSNTCFHNSKRCDGVKDCRGGEDEDRCDGE
ncbi:Vitellogenin receptor [Eumeta japonica]|uniref:Vitellogenin receptor n=1 Tax=Eumeta variegata TaxID=151549 RepID=A0A4C1WSG5_EUMVA|nr:Vitellogenin receptor [Eumeta japonica]